VVGMTLRIGCEAVPPSIALTGAQGGPSLRLHPVQPPPQCGKVSQQRNGVPPGAKCGAHEDIPRPGHRGAPL